MGLKSTAFELAARYLAGGIVREIAEGRRGARLQRAYLALRNRKTWSGFALFVVAGALEVYAPGSSSTVATVAAVLVAVGLLDKTWRLGLVPAGFGEAFRDVVAFGPAASAIVAGAVSLLGAVGSPWAAALAGQVEAWALAIGTSTAFVAAALAEPPRR